MRRNGGFTIVELLIVIVVIAVLAVITVVAFNGIRSRTNDSAAKSAAAQAAKKMEVAKASNGGTYPTSLSAAEIPNTNNKLQYTGSASNYCITATEGNKSYKVSDSSSSPTSGGCPGHGQGGTSAVTNLALNPNAEGSGSWGSSGAASGGYVTGFDGATRAYRSTKTSGSASTSFVIVSSIDSSSEYSAIATLRSSVSTTISVQIRPTSTNADLVTLGTVDLVANQPQTVKFSGVSSSVAYSSPRLTFFWAGGATGDYVEVTKALLSAGQYSGGYGDGNSTDWVWNGTPNASTSTGPSL